MKDEKIKPIKWVKGPIEGDDLTEYLKLSITMIDDYNRKVECRLNYQNIDLTAWLPFEAFEKSGVPIKPAQMFHLFSCSLNGEFLSWMEKYAPPMTEKKRKLLDKIRRL